MKPITDDKYCQFVIQHHKDIKAFNEVYGKAKIELPLCAAREVTHAILELENGFFKGRGLPLTNDGNEVWWCNPKSFKDETGPYLGFEPEKKTRWEWLVSTDPDDAMPLYFYVATHAIKGKAAKIKLIDKWAKQINAKKAKLLAGGILIEEEIDYAAPYLARRPLTEVNIELLADREHFRKKIQQIVKDFTLAFLPVLRKEK